VTSIVSVEMYTTKEYWPTSRWCPILWLGH